MRRYMLIAWLGSLSATAALGRDLTTVQVNLNQVGYEPADQKIALVETNRDLIADAALAQARILGFTVRPRC